MIPFVPPLIQTVSDDVLRAIVVKTFGCDAVLVEHRLLSGGQFNTSYYLQTNAPERLVLRIAPPEGRALFRYERSMMLAEPWIYRRLAEAGVPVPATVALDASRTVVDRVYIVQEFVDALPLNHPSVPAGALPGLWSEVGALTARIHGIRGNEFGWPVGDGSLRGGPSWTRVFGDLLRETCEAAVAAEVIGNADASTALQRFGECLPIFDACREPVLVHNDIWAPNVLVAPTEGEWRVRAVIDADRALFADREFEYVLWDGGAHYEDFMSGYGTALDGSVEASLRRTFYRFYWYLFAAWAYRAQIPKPESVEPNLAVAMEALGEIEAG